MQVLETDRWCKSKIDPGGEKPEKQGETASSTEKNLEKEEGYLLQNKSAGNYIM
jgi:hypothetical protein